MLFDSLPFLYFFAIVAAGYFVLPARWKPWGLLGANIWFYAAWDPRAAVLLGVCVAAAWWGGLALERHRGAPRQRVRLAAALLVPLGTLVVFKYANFFIDSAITLASGLGASWSIPALRLALPLGISFYTFKAMSYLFDVYRGVTPAQPTLLPVALYITFFPQILAGPIERAGAFFPQIDKLKGFDSLRVRDGAALFLWGLFKKAVIADRLAALVGAVYTAPGHYQGLPLIVATYCYAFQIYCDFSGYSDMAIGVARILGFTTIRNFDRPYHSTSVSEFWRRWHISLSRWFRDYLYIPLGGNRVSLLRWSCNVLIVFLISGLWHGSAWTFVVWGGLHGLFLVGERVGARAGAPLARWGLVRPLPRGVAIFSKVFVTFHLVTFAWIFFRASTIEDALHIVANLFTGLHSAGWGELAAIFGGADLLWALVLVASLEGVQIIRLRAGSAQRWLHCRPPWVRWAVCAALALGVINLRPQIAAAFIYLQF